MCDGYDNMYRYAMNVIAQKAVNECIIDDLLA